MTLVDRPLVQYAIDEAREAGIKEFIFVTSRGKGALEDYFDNAPQLEQELRKKGKDDLLEILKNTNMDSGEVAYMRQHKPLGLGHAVWCARRLIANEPFAVILPDDVIAAETSCLAQMVEAFEDTQSNIVAAMEVPEDKASSYGILDIKEDMGRIVSTKGMVEKPQAGAAPSNLAVIGRYILTPQILRNLNKKKTGAGGEIQLTDAIDEARESGEEVYGYRFEGQRFDCGSKSGFLQATVAFALGREDLRDDLWAYLNDVVHARKAAQEARPATRPDA
jgi:UTP--glucose-1-phosphate uridylyltransferase